MLPNQNQLFRKKAPYTHVFTLSIALQFKSQLQTNVNELIRTMDCVDNCNDFKQLDMLLKRI